MTTGKVKWFNNAKGYGFILPDSGESDLFVHYSSIAMDGYKTLKAGQDVEFDMQEGPKGFHAVNIRAQQGADADAEIEDPTEVESEVDDTPEVESEVDDTPEVESEVDDTPREPQVTLEDIDVLEAVDSDDDQPEAEQPQREGAAGSA